MRQIVRENRPVRETEMVACSARGLFLKEDHVAAVEALDEVDPKGLVSVLQIGSFFDLAEGPFCTSLQEVAAFQITDMAVSSDSIRIEGTAFPSKNELKSFLKALSKYAEENHLERGQSLKLWQWREGVLLWLPKGLKAKRDLLTLLKKMFDGIELRSTSAPLIDAYCRKRMPMAAVAIEEKWADPVEGRGLFEEGCQTIFQQTIYCSEKELKDFSISLLQIIDKTLIILGFNASTRLAGRKRLEEVLGVKADSTEKGPFLERVQWIVEDGLGREHIALELTSSEEKGCMLLRLKVGVERILALLLEQTGWDLKRIEQDFQT